MSAAPHNPKAPQPTTQAPAAPRLTLPELLAPAGDWECARAAIENGADAIYFGLEKFNARMRAHNFTEADLPRLMEFLHRRGARGYVTFNTLVFQNEMAEAEQYTRTLIRAGVDAVIVQDVGICRLIRSLSPDFPIHVSTQMTVTSAAGVEFARALGCNLVVLARECSLAEIGKMIGGPEAQGNNQAILPLEVFVHGALCVAYSGQCLTSEALGGRSANRGECAQACRMPYELVADGRPVPLGDRKYLLSPQDLAGLDLLPELVRVGVASLKIEGRLKTPEYVANITRLYRQALDRLAPATGSLRESDHVSPEEARYRMEMAFSRGLYTGWFRGTNNQELVHGRFGKKRGAYLGQVTEVRRDSVGLLLEGDLKLGDGIVFDAGHPESREEGGRVYEIRPLPKTASRNQVNGVRLGFGQGDIDFSKVHAGDRVWKTSDPELDRALRATFEGDLPKFQRPVHAEVHGVLDQPLTLLLRDELGHVVRVDSAVPLVKAEKQPLSEDRLRAQLGRMGSTAFKLGRIENRLPQGLMLPVSELNRLRREAVEQLDQLRARPLRWTLNPDAPRAAGLDIQPQPEEPKRASSATPQLLVLVRSLGQLEAALAASVPRLYCELEDPKGYREAVAMVRAAPPLHNPAGTARRELFVAPPRIFKMGEDWTLKQTHSCEADGYLVRNFDHLQYFSGDRCVGDYSLNIANRLSADYFKNRFHLERVTASYDLNVMQLDALLRAAPPEWFEITIHQHMPMFHMEHCIFCAFLSTGKDYRDCGRPCDRQELRLRDRVGATHPVKADAGCRNTVFNARAQTGADFVREFLSLGVVHFRIEFLDEAPLLVGQTIAKYQQLLRGEITGAQLWRELKLFNQLGVTRGQVAG